MRLKAVEGVTILESLGSRSSNPKVAMCSRGSQKSVTARISICRRNAVSFCLKLEANMASIGYGRRQLRDAIFMKRICNFWSESSKEASGGSEKRSIHRLRLLDVIP